MIPNVCRNCMKDYETGDGASCPRLPNVALPMLSGETISFIAELLFRIKRVTRSY